MRRADAANSHQPPLPSLNLQLIAHDVLQNAARDPTPRLLDVRVPVKKQATTTRLQFGQSGPARGLSNVRSGSEARVALGAGRLLIVETHLPGGIP